jgi:malic enzyme
MPAREVEAAMAVAFMAGVVALFMVEAAFMVVGAAFIAAAFTLAASMAVADISVAHAHSPPDRISPRMQPIRLRGQASMAVDHSAIDQSQSITLHTSMQSAADTLQ